MKTAFAILLLWIVALGYALWELDAELIAARKQVAQAATDVRHYKGRAYFLEDRYTEAHDAMLQEHGLEMWRLNEQLLACEARK